MDTHPCPSRPTISLPHARRAPEKPDQSRYPMTITSPPRPSTHPVRFPSEPLRFHPQPQPIAESPERCGIVSSFHPLSAQNRLCTPSKRPSTIFLPRHNRPPQGAIPSFIAGRITHASAHLVSLISCLSTSKNSPVHLPAQARARISNLGSQPRACICHVMASRSFQQLSTNEWCRILESLQARLISFTAVLTNI
ncbi:hypothetical protein BDP55DRAFT_663604 [Colletotrichum godetiae]|uniref:Uncharacterized protein n=1 Tax=Colletotrichum godetiae TaxID=1209918 RepID=A0AAJ0AM34_9PEZI|nr:uncharacterized protein BDP55DRAFT_663604 [Colletotrichum godetiae]KAK1675740.1 hypothetical protein BDP55DRAFT_663604 [Colletotrichum godetiae]